MCQFRDLRDNILRSGFSDVRDVRKGIARGTAEICQAAEPFCVERAGAHPADIFEGNQLEKFLADAVMDPLVQVVKYEGELSVPEKLRDYAGGMQEPLG